MLELVSFICGASVMVMEMAGSRLLAPHLGTSIVVWTALIGVILASLSLGYWLGGKAGDRNPNAGTLSRIILGAAAFVLVAAFLQQGLLPALTGLPLELAAIIAAALLFTVPSVLLGMVSPYIIQVKLALTKNTNKSGSVIGRFYAVSTIGSILGTFLGGYFLISWLGTRSILYAVAATLALAALLAMSGGGKKARAKNAVPVALLLLFSLAGGAFASTVGGNDPAKGVERDTRYNHVKVQEGYIGSYTSPMRFLITDPGSVQSGMLLASPFELALDYTRYYGLAWHIKPDAKTFLMLGGGGYSVPKYLLHTRPDAAIDVVEIDPGITAASREFFALPEDSRLTVHDEDARVFLNRRAAGIAADPAAGRYDIIMGDTFSSSYNIPFHLGTVECAERVFALLNEDGVFACNIISSITGDTGQVFRSIHASFAAVFPQVHVFTVSRKGDGAGLQNLMLVALKTPRALPLAWDEATRAMLDSEWTHAIPAGTPALTDDFGPVERYAMPILRAR